MLVTKKKLVTSHLDSLRKVDFPIHFDKTLELSDLWARKHGTERQLAECRFATFLYAFRTTHFSDYDFIVAANRVWNLRHHLMDDEIMAIHSPISILFQRIGRSHDLLELTLEHCRILSKDSTNICSKLGVVYQQLKQYPQALKHYRKELSYERKAGRALESASLLNNMGDVFFKLGMPDSARICFEQSLIVLKDTVSILRSTNPRYHGHFTNIVRWSLIKAQNQPELTNEQLRLARSINRSSKLVREAHWEVISAEYLASHFYKTGENDSALYFINQAITKSKTSNLLTHVPELIGLKARMLLTVGERKLADEQFELSQFLRDSIAHAETEFEAIVAAAQNESKEKDRELVQSRGLTREAQLKAEKESSRRQLVLALLLTSLLVLGLVLLMFRYTSKNRKLIAIQKDKLEKSLGEKEILIKEIHHRVKNNLQVISSLLELQSNRLPNEDSKRAIQAGQNRVRSIALIHKQLYEHDDLSGVEMASFIKDFFGQIRSALHSSSREVNLELDCPEVVFDVDTAVPLGLILNELITNSFKYGIGIQGGGTISIGLQQLKEGAFQLLYSDSGPGIPEGIDFKNHNSLGMRLIGRLSRQLGGNAKVNLGENWNIEINFKDTKAREEVD